MVLQQVSCERSCEVGRIIAAHDSAVSETHFFLISMHFGFDHCRILDRSSDHFVGGLVVQQIFDLNNKKCKNGDNK